MIGELICLSIDDCGLLSWFRVTPVLAMFMSFGVPESCDCCVGG